MNENRHEFVVTESDDNSRLDLVIMDSRIAQLNVLSRSQCKKLILAGHVRINQAVCSKAGTTVKVGDVITVQFQPTEDVLPPHPLDIEILFEDEEVLVLNKPAGITMHPGAGTKNDTLANMVAPKLANNGAGFPSGTRPGIVHRLDRDTTGVIVVAKTAAAHTALSKQFFERTVDRRYHTLVLSTPRANRLVQRESSGCIQGNIGRDKQNRLKFTTLDSGGKNAVTHWRQLEQFAYGTLLEIRLETGRTHQIRVHMEHVLSPVIGDRTYGDFSLLPKFLATAAESFGRQALHAVSLAFDHPASGERLHFTTELPDDMKKLIEQFAQYAV